MLLRVDLDKLASEPCPNPECHDHPDIAVFQCLRHGQNSLLASYEKGSGLLKLICTKCGVDRPIAAIIVADGERYTAKVE